MALLRETYINALDTLDLASDDLLTELRKVIIMQGETNWISTSEAAKLLDTTAQTIRRMIARGDIPAQKVKFGQSFRYMIDKRKLEGIEVNKPGRQPDEKK